jgi:glycosyltransferase involved in cell wall biosynthesis
MKKKRILLANESSFQSTGYSTMGRAILSRLHKSPKYEVAELGTYGSSDDPRSQLVPWKFYPVVPSKDDEHSTQIYNSKIENQHGAWCWEKTCLDFEPDIIIDFRDSWVWQYQLFSPLRDYYTTIHMPTIDATPQHDDWIYDINMSDSVLTYTQFGMDVLKKHGGNNINLIDVAPPGAEFEDMNKLDKNSIRDKYGLPRDAIIITMVARNQMRKLYPDLLETFRHFLENAPEDIARRAYLHIHTSYPDLGWNLPRILKEHRVGHRTLFTYMCRMCAFVRVSKWNDVITSCPRCLNKAMTFSGPSNGLRRKQLCEIYNLGNIYVQLAKNEGFGVPIVEAAACGLPVMVVNYSAMEDFPKTLGAIPIEPVKYDIEAPTHRKFALPDNKQVALQLIDAIQNNDLEQLGNETKKKCIENYDWDKIIKIWESAIDNAKEPVRAWKSPPKEFLPYDKNAKFPDNEQFVEYAIKHISGNDRLLNSHLFKKMVTELNMGISQTYEGFPYWGELSSLGLKPKIEAFGRENVIKFCEDVRSVLIFWENERCKKFCI